MTSKAELFLGFLNNYLTISCFAECKDLEIEEAKEVLRIGKIEYNDYCNEVLSLK